MYFFLYFFSQIYIIFNTLTNYCLINVFQSSTLSLLPSQPLIAVPSMILSNSQCTLNQPVQLHKHFFEFPNHFLPIKTLDTSDLSKYLIHRLVHLRIFFNLLMHHYHPRFPEQNYSIYYHINLSNFAIGDLFL